MAVHDCIAAFLDARSSGQAHSTTQDVNIRKGEFL